MIIKVISRMADPGGLARYLAGKGTDNEHTDQHTVAGTVHYQGDLSTDKDLVAQIAADLRAYSKLWPDVSIPEGAIWHTTISLPTTDGVLSDDAWASITQDYMTRMGLTDPRKAPIRWTAVRHGLSTEGNDHVHIVANLVREDGTKASVWNAWPKSQRIATALEQKYNLTQLSTRVSGAASVPLSKAEIKAAEKQQQEPARVTLERNIRANAASSATEAEFLRRVRADGILIRPRLQDNEVTGYSVGLPGAGTDGGPAWFAAGRLARDLTIPRLRTSWDHTPADARAAADEWAHGRAGRPVVRYGRETQPPPSTTVGDVTRKFTELRTKISTATLPELSEIAGDLAGTLAAASRATEPPSTPGPLARASRQAGSYAGTRGYNAERGPNALRDIAMLMLVLKDPNSEGAQQVMFRQILLTLTALSKAHRHRAGEQLSNPSTQKGTRMTAPAEKSDETLEGLATMGVTIGAMSVATALSKVHHKGTTHIPKEEREGMDAWQRTQTAGAPGSEDSFAFTQQRRLRILSDAAGKPAVIPPGLTVDAQIGRLERQLGPKGLAALHAQGLSGREWWPGENGPESHEVLPPKPAKTETGVTDAEYETYVNDPRNEGLDPMSREEYAASVGKPVEPAKVTGPKGWKTANEPMTYAQMAGIQWRSRRLGIDPLADIDGLSTFTKADASEAITALDNALKKGASQDQARVLLLTPDVPITTASGSRAQGITQATPPSPMDWKASGDKLGNSSTAKH